MSLFYCLSLFSVVLLVICLTVKGGDAGGEKNEVQSQATLGSADNPASSCREIMDTFANSQKKPSGYYHVKNGAGKTVRVYCEMAVNCGDDYGWFRIAKFDMRNTSHTCPDGLVGYTSAGGTRMCIKDGDQAGCSSTMYSSLGIYYQKFCGRIIGSQIGTTDAFARISGNEITRGSIDEPYVDGVSLTYGYSARHHIWTWASALIDGGNNGNYNDLFICPCSNPVLGNPGTFIPSFVGDNYFCDSGVDTGGDIRGNNDLDPLWDGAGCSIPSTCCSFNDAPFFENAIGTYSDSDVEMRVCRDQEKADEDVGVISVEIYIL